MSQIDLLMVHADDHEPVLPDGLPEGTTHDQTVSAERPIPNFLTRWGGDPNSLAEQGWGVLVPAGAEGDRLLQIIDPLIQARKADQLGNEVKIYRIPKGPMDMADAVAWKKTYFDTGKESLDDLPRYQLILGDLHQVPLAIQQVQSSEYFVGRLAFANDAGYEAYVHKLLRSEKQDSTVAMGRSLLYTVHDHSAATDAGYRMLMEPGLALVNKWKTYNNFKASQILELGDFDMPSPGELLAKVQDPDPSVLFTLSHGLGPPRAGWRSVAEQQQRQGAMSFGNNGNLFAADLEQQAFMPGGLWFMLACYGAGTPEASAYLPWLAALKEQGQFSGRPEAVLAGLPKPGDQPFIAALPQAVLRNEKGPLAFIGHVDLAWTYSFSELDTGKAESKPAKFMAILNSALQGNRVGVAFDELMRYFAGANTELSTLFARDAATSQPPPPNSPAALAATRRGHLWMLRQDLAGYVLLGDPAAQLQFQDKQKATRAAREAEMAAREAEIAKRLAEIAKREAENVQLPTRATTNEGKSTNDQSSTTDPPLVPLPKPIEQLEDAFGKILAGDPDLDQAKLRLNEAASWLGMSQTALQDLFDQYRKGGRFALGIK